MSKAKHIVQIALDVTDANRMAQRQAISCDKNFSDGSLHFVFDDNSTLDTGPWGMDYCDADGKNDE